MQPISVSINSRHRIFDEFFYGFSRIFELKLRLLRVPSLSVLGSKAKKVNFETFDPTVCKVGIFDFQYLKTGKKNLSSLEVNGFVKLYSFFERGVRA
jgi:hypothetical protein